MAPNGGSGSRRTSKRQAILAATEGLILTEGYGAITYRSVAAAAEVTAGLVKYYFPALDELFVAVLRESTDRLIERLTSVTGAAQPLRAVWAYANSAGGTALLMQFAALAQQVPEVRKVVGEGGERVRQALVQTLSDKWADYGLADTDLTPGAALFLLAAIPRMMFLEQSLGTSTGHQEALALVEHFLDRVEPLPE
ncbi:TetR family transcriptional regulator [Mycobacterium sp. Y57]|uniref:TetR/AcrR family transcriptional regulator n=1 Tax=Mycolicibacterium xanthum TaxID=2796469 RepID=UPI001C841228|nr:TetR family transcriptional regulator [Mycolicibacterium xanthum]MBX7433923.1 TetR family transcriptional regulator [Mycolicibacterium xanthum]